MAKIQAIRGMNDLLPEQTPIWQHVESQLRVLAQRYGYRELRMPLLEQTQLFKRSIGEVTDIVEKEMYSFEDRSGDSLSLRPEGTAGCVRAAEQHGLLYNQQQRLWYLGPMFRYERPQKGRYRQFHQFGLETFGFAGPDIDAEVILFSARLWQQLGIAAEVRLEINNIGSAEDRQRFGKALVDWLAPRREQLDADSQRRLQSNPLRILDSKDAATQALLADAPELADYVSEQSRQHHDGLKALLDAAGVAYVENPRLVRGLDYYNATVFEWITDSLGAQGTVCAGGRYDSLVSQLGGRATPAFGFGMGMERLVLLVEQCGELPADINRIADVYLLSESGQQVQAMLLAEQLRAALPQLRIICHCGGGKRNSQIKKAFQLGARVTVALGEPGALLALRALDESLAARCPVESEVNALAGVLATLLATLGQPVDA